MKDEGGREELLEKSDYYCIIIPIPMEVESMTLMYESPIPGPATHVLVIGVGYDHHLPSNTNPRQPFTTVLIDG